MLVTTLHFYIQVYVTIPGELDLIIYAFPFQRLFISIDLAWLFKEIQYQKDNFLFAEKESSPCTRVPEQYKYLHFFSVLKCQQALGFPLVQFRLLGSLV